MLYDDKELSMEMMSDRRSRSEKKPMGAPSVVEGLVVERPRILVGRATMSDLSLKRRSFREELRLSLIWFCSNKACYEHGDGDNANDDNNKNSSFWQQTTSTKDSSFWQEATGNKTNNLGH